jgi:ketosteroid isomerase-like protein
MAGDVEIERALEAVTAALNEPQFDGFDRRRVQEIVDVALGGEQWLTVDPGGGLHDESERRVGVIRRTPSGEWIAERQNPAAARSEARVPAD